MHLILVNGSNLKIVHSNLLIKYLKDFDRGNDQYISLKCDKHGYIQSIKTLDKRYILEFKDILGELYISKRDNLTIEEIIRIFMDYFNGNYSWKERFQWEHIELFPNNTKREFHWRDLNKIFFNNPEIKLHWDEKVDKAFKNFFPMDFNYLFESVETIYIKGAIFFSIISLILYILLSYGFL
ncbi:MAG: hypothetical protein K0R02_496 [Rickettsiaceae bacterium]|jgi:hypothetical protein|nr:hypothetical protein [Rickettsiaceae bacterium]